MNLQVKIAMASVVLLGSWAWGQGPCVVQVLVGEHKNVSVTIPCVSKPDATEIISTFFGRGDEAAKKKFENVLGQSGELTLTITTHRPTATAGRLQEPPYSDSQHGSLVGWIGNPRTITYTPSVVEDRQPIDEPAIQVSDARSGAGMCSQGEKPSVKNSSYCIQPRDTCADKSRILLTAEDGKKWCHAPQTN